MILVRAFVTLAVLSAAGPALAQQAMQPQSSDDPKTEATESLLLQELTSHRNWQATAIAKDRALQLAQKQIFDAQAQVGDLQKQLDALKAPPASAP